MSSIFFKNVIESQVNWRRYEADSVVLYYKVWKISVQIEYLALASISSPYDRAFTNTHSLHIQPERNLFPTNEMKNWNQLTFYSFVLKKLIIWGFWKEGGGGG